MVLLQPICINMPNAIYQCAQCVSVKGLKAKSRGLMKQYNIGMPFESIAVNITKLFPTTLDGNRFILVAMDYFIEWPKAYASLNQEALTIARVLENVFSIFRLPVELYSNQERNFKSAIFK